MFADRSLLDYGFNRIIKEYAGFPQWLPLPCHCEHGWTVAPDPLATDLNTAKGLMLVYSRRREKAWKARSSIPVRIIGDPLLQYRRLHGIQQSPTARGTIAFPSHSTPWADALFDIHEYCRLLRNLPCEFQPVTVCLHSDDVQSGKGEPYGKNGFEVVTAGNRFDPDFAANFFANLRRHRYATSNDVGSYILYAVELSIPFFFLGEVPLHDNCRNDPNEPRRFRKTDYPIGKQAYTLFSKAPAGEITSEQRRFVAEESGLLDCIGPQDLRKLLWQKLLGWELRRGAVWLVSAAGRKIRRCVSAVVGRA